MKAMMAEGDLLVLEAGDEGACELSDVMRALRSMPQVAQACLWDDSVETVALRLVPTGRIQTYSLDLPDLQRLKARGRIELDPQRPGGPACATGTAKTIGDYAEMLPDLDTRVIDVRWDDSASYLDGKPHEKVIWRDDMDSSGFPHFLETFGQLEVVSAFETVEEVDGIRAEVLNLRV